MAASIGAGLARAALAGIVNDTPVDLDAVVSDGDSVAIVTAKSDEGLELMRHSTAHLLAAALTDMYPGVKFGVGPAIENGFYYDIELPEGATVSPDDFAAIEARMAEIAKSGAAIVRREVTRDEAREIFADQPLKLELIDELPEDETISIYQLGDFTDLCRGPHVPDTGKLGAYKLTKVAGAYWKGDSDNEMLTRIYGTAFFGKKELEEYLHNLEEAEKRDHRKLGRELGIYMMEPMAGVGLPLYLPKGARVIRTLQEWLRRDLYERGYEEVITPHIYNADVWKTSGHYGFYHENMYFFQINEGTDEEPRYSEYGVKPMNCPGHVIIYKNELHSYRDLPLRYFEFGTVYRHEMSGVVHGLLARPRLHPGRRPHLLHQGPGGRRGGRHPGAGGLHHGHLRLHLRGRDLHAPGQVHRHRRHVGARHRIAEGGLRAPRPGLRHQRGRRRLLRPEDRHQGEGRHRAHLAVLHGADRLQHAHALRADLPHRGQHRGDPLDAAPRHLRLHRALPRHPHRALRRRAAAVAGPGAGGRHPHRRPPQGGGGRVCRRAEEPWAAAWRSWIRTSP